LTRGPEYVETVTDNHNGEELEVRWEIQDHTIAKKRIGLVRRKANLDQSPVIAISRSRIFKPEPIKRKIRIQA
jgi:hypothetical protein